MVLADSLRGSLGCLFALLALVAQSAQARDKTDVITLRNGDHITGEILTLQYGQLQLKTDDMGTLNIEWDAIATIESRYFFDVEQIGGQRFYGLLSSTPDGSRVTVHGPAGDSIEIEPSRVTRIAKLESTFWSRIDGSFSIGYNFTKSTDITVISGNLDATYRSEKIIANFGVDVNSSKSPETGTLDRDQVSFGYNWLLPNRNFWAGILNWERNEELGIESRVQLGGGFGRYVYQTPHSEIAAFAGAAVSREWVTGSEDGQESTEGIVGASWRIFRLNTPKRSLTSQFVVYPSFTESGRYRGKADVSWRQEIIKDFFFDVSFYYDYDNQPPGDATSKDDYGLVTSLGYTF